MRPLSQLIFSFNFHRVAHDSLSRNHLWSHAMELDNRICARGSVCKYTKTSVMLCHFRFEFGRLSTSRGWSIWRINKKCQSSVRKSVIKSNKSIQEKTAASRILSHGHSQNLLNSVRCRDVERLERLVKVRMYLWSTGFQPSSSLDSQLWYFCFNHRYTVWETKRLGSIHSNELKLHHDLQQSVKH